MIAVSVQLRLVLDPTGLRHFALPPLDTNDFDAARQFVDAYMRLHWPLHRYTVHMINTQWEDRSELVEPFIENHNRYN